MAVADVAVATPPPDYFITLAITVEHQDPMLKLESGKHMAMIDGGANLSVVAIILAMLHQSVGSGLQTKTIPYPYMLGWILGVISVE